jgi:hypothetical protein
MAIVNYKVGFTILAHISATFRSLSVIRCSLVFMVYSSSSFSVRGCYAGICLVFLLLSSDYFFTSYIPSFVLVQFVEL